MVNPFILSNPHHDVDKFMLKKCMYRDKKKSVRQKLSDTQVYALINAKCEYFHLNLCDHL